MCFHGTLGPEVLLVPRPALPKAKASALLTTGVSMSCLPGLRHAWRCLGLTHVPCGQFILVRGCCFIRAAQSVDIWVVSMTGLLRVVLLWSFSVGLWWTCIRHLCCCGHGVTGQAVSTPRFSAGPCLLSPSWGVCVTVPSSVLTLASWCSGCFSPACGLCEPSF